MSDGRANIPRNAVTWWLSGKRGTHVALSLKPKFHASRERREAGSERREIVDFSANTTWRSDRRSSSSRGWTSASAGSARGAESGAEAGVVSRTHGFAAEALRAPRRRRHLNPIRVQVREFRRETAEDSVARGFHRPMLDEPCDCPNARRSTSSARRCASTIPLCGGRGRARARRRPRYAGARRRDRERLAPTCRERGGQRRCARRARLPRRRLGVGTPHRQAVGRGSTRPGHQSRQPASLGRVPFPRSRACHQSEDAAFSPDGRRRPSEEAQRRWGARRW